MRWRAMYLLLPAVVVLASCSTTRGSGTLATEARVVTGFAAVDLSGSGNLVIEQTGTDSLTIEAENNILPLLTSDVAAGTLRLGEKNGTGFKTTKPISYRLTVKELSRIVVSGTGTVTASNLAADTLSVHISGSGSVSVSGTADRQEIDIPGSGDYQANDLPSPTVVVDISGSGHASVTVSEALDVSISGSGTVTYDGNPTITQDVGGSDKIIGRSHTR